MGDFEDGPGVQGREGRGVFAGWIPILVLAAAGGLFAFYPSGDPDVFFHLATGREIARTGTLPATEPFCFPSVDRPFVNHEWLFDVALWGAFRAGGAAGVVWFKVSLAALLFGLIGIVGRRMGAGPWPMVLVGVGFLPLFRASLEARPHLAGYAMTAATIICLFGLERGRKACLAALAVLMVLWANTHGSFPLAFALWGIFAVRAFAGRADRPKTRTAMMLTAGPLLAIACLANPWGIGIFGTILHHMEPLYREIVPEWGPVRWGEQPARDLLYLVLAASALLSFLPRANRGRVALIAILALFLAQAVLSIKFTLGLAVGAVPVLAANLSAVSFKRRGSLKFAGASLAAVSVLALTPLLAPWKGPGLGFDLRDFPQDALEYAKENNLSGRMFNPFNQGGFCEFQSHPRLRAFIDGRAYVHGLDGIRTYMNALSNYDNFKKLNDKYGFDLVLADIQDPSFPRLDAGLGSDPAFSMVWLDSHFAMFVPTQSNEINNIKPYRVLRPTTDPRYLFGLNGSSVLEARNEVSRVLESAAGKTLGRLLAGVLELRAAGVGSTPDSLFDPGVDQSGCKAAEPDLEALVDSNQEAPMFRYFLAAARACAGRCDDAREQA
ncbi:MAG: hypothetical protein GXP54_10070, partial [Deltaproteobacteria bacterium]|nr:hypothetical protein [Deltaproteobacteria bacterium]